MRKFLPPHRALSERETQVAKAKLAKEVLYEVPAQLIGYMKSKGNLSSHNLAVSFITHLSLNSYHYQ
jgi:hypothetical protein